MTDQSLPISVEAADVIGRWFHEVHSKMLPGLHIQGWFTFGGDGTAAFDELYTLLLHERVVNEKTKRREGNWTITSGNLVVELHNHNFRRSPFRGRRPATCGGTPAEYGGGRRGAIDAVFGRRR